MNIRTPILAALLGSLVTSAVMANAPPPWEGLWWDPERPGSGVSISMTGGDGWFLVVYGQGHDGAPIFLTAQGSEREFDPTQSPATTAAHGIMRGLLQETRFGPCLACPPGITPQTGEALIGEIAIGFQSPTQAVMTLAGQTWNLEPFVRERVDQVHFTTDRLHLVHARNQSDEAVVLAKGRTGRGIYFTGMGGSGLVCLSCDALAQTDTDPDYPERVRRMVEGIETAWGPGPGAPSRVYVYDTTVPGTLFDFRYRFFLTAEGNLVASGFEADAEPPSFAATRFEIRPLPSEWGIGAIDD